MPYSIRLPNGTSVDNIPDDVPLEVARAQILKKFPELAPPVKRSTVGGEFAKSTATTFGNIGAGLETLISSKDAARAAQRELERGQALEEQYGVGPSLEAIKESYAKEGLFPSIGTAISQAPKLVAGMAPAAATIWGAGKLGAMAGAPLGGPVGAVVGGTGAALTAATLLALGSDAQRQAQEDIAAGRPVDIDRSKAIPAAVAQGALDVLAQQFTLGGGKAVKKLFGVADDVALGTAKAEAEALKQAKIAASGRTRAIAGGAARGVVSEMPTELAQLMLERAQADLPLTNQDAMREYLETAYATGTFGSIFGGAAGLHGRGKAKAAIQEREAAAAAQKAQGEEAKAAEQPAPTTPAAPSSLAAPAYDDAVRRRAEAEKLPKGPAKTALLREIDAELKELAELGITSGEAVRPEPVQLELGGTEISPEERAKLVAERTRLENEERQAAEDAARAERAREARQIAPTQTYFPEMQPLTVRDVAVRAAEVGVGPGAQSWMLKNLVGKSLHDIDRMVKANPKLMEGTSQRAEVLRSFLEPINVPAFQEQELTNERPGVAPADGGVEPDVAAGGAGTEVLGDVAGPEPVGAPVPAGGLAEPDQTGVGPVEPASAGVVAGEAPQPGALEAPIVQPEGQLGLFQPEEIPVTAVAPVVEAAPVASVAEPKIKQGELFTPSGKPTKAAIVARQKAQKAKAAEKKAKPAEKPAEKPAAPKVDKKAEAAKKRADREAAAKAKQEAATKVAQEAETKRQAEEAEAKKRAEIVARQKAAKAAADKAKAEEKVRQAAAKKAEAEEKVRQAAAEKEQADAKRKAEKARQEAEAKRQAAEAEAVAKREKEKAERAKMDPREQARERRSELELDPETTKAKVRAFANKLLTQGLITDKEHAEVARIQQDRELGADDMLDELRFLLDNPAEPKVEEAVQEAEAKRKADEAEAKRKADEAEAKRKADEAEAKRKADEAEAKRKADEAARKGEEGRKSLEKLASYYPSGKLLFNDGRVGLLRTVGVLGNSQYRAVLADTHAMGVVLVRDPITGSKSGLTSEDRAELKGRKFSDADIDLLRAEAERAFDEDQAALDKYPDGPFTGTTASVVKSSSVKQSMADLLADWMRLVNIPPTVRIFLLHPEDVRADPGKYHLHGGYISAMSAGVRETENGATRSFGVPGRHYISVRSGMSDARSIEVLAHELGHVIERELLDGASPEVKEALRAAHAEWLAKHRKGTTREYMHALRAPESALTAASEDLMGEPAEELLALSSYWSDFGEWFADQTSRWATTSEKPVSLVDKFFKSVADAIRKLVSAVTGRDYAPDAAVAKFLDEMTKTGGNWTDFKPSLDTRARQMVAPATQTIFDEMKKEQQAPAKGFVKSVLTHPGGWGINALMDTEGAITKARTRISDRMATVEQRFAAEFNDGVRSALGKINPILLLRQAEDAGKLLADFFLKGTLAFDKALNQFYVTTSKNVRPPAAVYELVKKWGEKHGKDFKTAKDEAAWILEAVRLHALRESNITQGTKFGLHMKDARIDALYAEYKADPILREMNTLMDESRKAMVDNLVTSGRISQEMGQAWKDAVGYVPFNRVDDITDFATKFRERRRVGKGVAQLGGLPELVGSESRPVKNVFDNYINTMGWMVQQTVRNTAVVQALRAMEKLPGAQAKYLGEAKHAAASPDRTVGTYIKGDEVFFEVPTAYDAIAFSSMDTKLPLVFKWMQQVSNVLRTAITAVPTFSAKQIVEDAQRAILQSGVRDGSAATNAALRNFWQLSKAELKGQRHPAVEMFGEHGLTGEIDWSNSDPAGSLLKDLGLEDRKLLGSTAAGKLLHRLEGIARASDLAVRKAIYDQTIIETTSTTMPHGDKLLALTRAREIINFRRRGAGDKYGLLNMAVQTVPFFNAYIQGMDVLLRALTGKNAASGLERQRALKLFYSRAAMMGSISLMYALLAGDDEEYDGMDREKRDSSFLLGHGIRIPVASELGILFKAPIERAVEYFRKQGTPAEMEASEAIGLYMSSLYNQMVGRVTPLPQALRPMFEAFSNFSFRTMRPIEGVYQKGLLPSERTTATTSEFAKSVAKFVKETAKVEVSPVMIDHVFNGYLGTTAAITTAVADAVVNPDKIDRPLHRIVGLSAFTYDPVGAKYMSDFYDLREKVVQTHNSLEAMKKMNPERAAKFAEENAPTLMFYSVVNGALQRLQATRAYKNWLTTDAAAKELTSEERLQHQEEVRKQEKELAAAVLQAKRDAGI